MRSYLGIDIGGSSIKYGWGHSKPGLQHFGKQAITVKDLDHFHAAVATMFTTIDKLHPLKDFAAIGIATAGMISTKDDTIRGVNPNLPFWVNLRPDSIIPPSFTNPVFCDNDANLMALAEADVLGCLSLIGITVGSGIGCGIIQAGQTWRGAHGYAGELGHAIMVEDGALCGCGNRGCLEAYSSVDGMIRRLGEHSPRYLQFGLLDLLANRAGDEIVNQVINTGMKHLATALAQAVVLLDPDAVVLGGGAMELNLFDLNLMQAQILARLPKAHQQSFRLFPAHYGNQAGVWGAIVLCERSMR